MSKNSAPQNADVIMVKPKDVEVVNDNKLDNDSNASFGKQLLSSVVMSAAQAGVPVVIEMVKGRIDDDRESKKKGRDILREILQKEHNLLLQNIEKEEAREDYNQERIDKWNERIDKIKQDLFTMDQKSDSFIEGVFNSVKELIFKSGSK